MPDKKITIEEFVAISGVKKTTIRKNSSKIPGLRYINGEYEIIKGTRYPGDFHRYKLKNSGERRYVLLKAISEYKYIDHIKLRLYKEQFDALLRELLDAELICENHLFNHFGANAYDCTPHGDEILKQEKAAAIQSITNCVASASGHFLGAIISEVFNGEKMG